MRWYWWISIMIIVVATKATIYYSAKEVWAYLTTPQERAACQSVGYAEEVVIAGCTKMIESRAYDDQAIAMAYYRRGHAFAQRRRWTEALDDYSQALLLNPRFPAALNNRAHTLQMLNRHKDSLKDLDDALALVPDFRLAVVNRAIALRTLGEYGRAIEDLDRAIALDDSDAATYRHRGLTLRDMRDTSGAMAAFTRAIELDPREVQSYFARGAIYFDSQQYDKAIEDFSYAYDLAPGHPATLLMRAESYERSGKREAAVADYRRLLALQPGNYPAQLALARLGSAGGMSDEKYCHGPYDMDARMKACTRAIDSGVLGPDAAVKALLARAAIHLHHLNRAGDAADDIDRAAAIAPDDLRVLEWRGIVALRLKSYGRALASFEAMLKRDPNQESARLGRAHAMLGLKRYREALPEFDRAVKRRPEMGQFYMYRGQAYEGLGQRDAAIRDYRTAYRRAPNLAEARQALARMGEEP